MTDLGDEVVIGLLYKIGDCPERILHAHAHFLAFHEGPNDVEQFGLLLLSDAHLVIVITVSRL